MSKKDKKENEDMMKVITLGESGVGKSSIIKRYVKNIFEDETLSTIGLNFYYKQIKLKNGKTLQFKLIDTAGQEKYKALSKSYFKNAEAVLFIFAFNSQDSFDNIKNWIELFDENRNGKTGIPKYLVGNKSDKEKEVDDGLINQLKEEYKDFKYYKTSAKNNDGIDKMFQDLGEDLYKILVEKKGNPKTQKGIKITKYSKPKPKKDCICSSGNEDIKNKD